MINKIDLLPHLDFDLDKLLYNLDAVNPGVAADAGQRPHRRGRGRVRREWLLELAHAGRGVLGVSAVRDAGAVGRCSRRASSSAGRPASASSAREAERLARLCHRMAERFARGGRLIAFGCSAPRALGRRATSRSSSSTR